jgi:transposase-like protein
MHATWQRCRVHFMRNVLVHAPAGQRRMVSALIGTMNRPGFCGGCWV